MNEITKTEDQKPKTKDRLLWLLLALAAVFIYFYGLSIPLLGPDEPRYSQVAREMFERGDWVTPTLGGFDWFEKPALLYWLQIAAYNVFGVTEFAARLGSALFGLGTIFSLWILGRFLAAEGAEKHRENANVSNADSLSVNSVPSVAKNDFANWLALIAASSIGLLVFARGASFDIILTFPITASLVGFFIHDQSEKKSGFAFRFSLFAFHFFVGVALLAKGLIGIVFPLTIVAFYYVLSRRRPSKTFVFSLFWGTILSLAVAASWYLPMYLANGWKFIDEFFIQHHFQRYTSNKYLHPQPFWFFWVVLPLMTIPWLPFFLASIWNLIKIQNSKFKIQNSKKTFFSRLSLSPLQAFAAAWMLVPLVFFSLSGSKLPGYILPALPAALILTAKYVYQFAQKSDARRFALQGLALAMFVVVFLILQFFIDDYARRETVKNLINKANAEGYADAKILTLHTISHNAEFYGAGRLVRLPDGKQRYHFGVAEVAEHIRQNENKPVLVIVPLRWLKDLTESNLVSSRVLADNGEDAIVYVEPKLPPPPTFAN